MSRKLSRRTHSSAHADAFVFEVESIEDGARGPNKETLSSRKTEKHSSDISEGSETAKISNKKKRRTKRKVKKAKKENISPASLEKREGKFVLQDNTVGTTLSASSTSSSPDAELPHTASINDVNGSLEKGTKKHKTARKQRLQRQDAFDTNLDLTDEEFSIKRASFTIAPSPRKKTLRASKTTSISDDAIETVDLTESDSSPRKLASFNGNCFSPSGKSTRSTFDKMSLNMSASEELNSNEKENLNSTFVTDEAGNRKSSFEISFNLNKHRAASEEVLDHLNITRRDSRKSSFKKSSRGFTYSTGSENEDPKDKFVTVRKQCQSMIDFDTGHASEDFINEKKSGLRKFKNSEKLNEQEIVEKKLSIVPDKTSSNSSSASPVAVKRASTKKFSPKKGILKQSIGHSRRDTFEIAECFFQSLEAAKLPSTITEATPNKRVQPCRDVFDIVSHTPKDKLDHMMIGSGESVLIADSFMDQTRRLTRMNTFTIDEEVRPPPQPEVRKSTRKRWTPARKIEFQNDVLNGTKNKSVTFYASDLIPTKSEEPAAITKPKGKKSVKIETPLNTPKTSLRSPLVARKTPRPKSATADESRQNDTLNGTINISEKKAAENKENRKKSVRIDSPVKTPKMALHTPLVARKTPKPVFAPADNSILAEDLKFESRDDLKGSKTKSEEQATPNKAKGRTPIRVASPLRTPKMRMHAPLAFPPADSSILAGNCAFTYLTSTSTPYPTTKEVPLLKKVLTNEKSKLEKTTKNSSRVKMPNFRKIHERQFEKMEDIKSLQKRKALRAQFLMSGCKVIPNTSVPQDTEKELRKKLLFHPVEAEKQTDSSSKQLKISKPLQHMLNKKASLEKKKKEERKKNDLKSKLPVSQKPVVAAKSIPIPQRKKIASPAKKNAEPNVVTRFGFKMPSRQSLSKEDQIKAVTTKSKPTVNRVEKHRTQINTVRTNRRFELLMKMRANQK